MTTTVVHKNNLPYFGETPLLKAASTRSFASLIFETLSGTAPSESQSKLFELILNLSIDHGPDTPSALATISAKGSQRTLPESVAAGISQINHTHGGAIEPAMELFYKLIKDKTNLSTFLSKYLSESKRLPGFGHRIYQVDPRTQLILKHATDLNLPLTYFNLANHLESQLFELKGKPVPLNIDGAIAAVLCTFGWPHGLGQSVFICARTPGLCAHASITI